MESSGSETSSESHSNLVPSIVPIVKYAYVDASGQIDKIRVYKWQPYFDKYNVNNSYYTKYLKYKAKNNNLKNKITTKILYDILTINEKYNILENNSHSLKNNCELVGITNPKFAQAFFEVLNDLNLTDVNKLKSFLQFWLGKSSIRSFNGERCKIVQTTYQLHGCIKSSTCFNQIYVERTLTEGDSLKSYLIESINKTLNNQLISETAGLNMQNS